MKKIVKQSVGIDVAQNELVVSFGRLHEDWSWEVFAFKTFANNKKGFTALLSWVNQRAQPGVEVQYVMEATGVYHESLAYFLDDQGCNISIVLPNKISNYFRTLNVKTITDKTASEVIARFSLERKLENWKRPKAVFKRLRQLTRERGQLVDQRTVAKNQLHAEKAEAEPNKSTLARLTKVIALFDKLQTEVSKEITAVIKEDQQVNAAVKLISSIPGVGELTAATVLAETNGFELIRNKRQLTSYAGLDIKEKQSGTSVRGKARISKRGNKYLRRSMHLPALAAIRHDQRFKAVFVRLVGKHGIKMKAAVAVQRKLLEMIYTVYKTQQPYDKNYLNKEAAAIVKN
jgi:transposase